MNFNSPEWQEVAERLRKDIDQMKNALVREQTEQQTAFARGSIRALTWVLAWADEKQAAEQSVEFDV
jgi:hypothetical protein